MIDAEALIWTDTDGIPLTDDNGLPVKPEPEQKAILFVSIKYFLRYMESAAENPETLRLVDAGFMDLDPEIKQEVIQSFLAIMDSHRLTYEKGVVK